MTAATNPSRSQARFDLLLGPRRGAATVAGHGEAASAAALKMPMAEEMEAMQVSLTQLQEQIATTTSQIQALHAACTSRLV